MYSNSVHYWYIEAPKRKVDEQNGIPRLVASHDSPLFITLEQFIRAYHVLTNDEKHILCGAFESNEWNSPVKLGERYHTFPDMTNRGEPSVDQLLRSLLLILDTYYERTRKITSSIDIETLIQNIDMTPQRVASLIELLLLNGQYTRAIDMLTMNVSKISRKRLERACKANATFMLPKLLVFVEKNVTHAKDALAMCMKLQNKNETIAMQLITHASLDPWSYLTEAITYKMFSLAERIIQLPLPNTTTYSIDSKVVNKLLKYPRCDAIVQVLCTMQCFAPSRYTIALELFKVPRFRAMANALIPISHPNWFEYMRFTSQLQSLDMHVFVQTVNAMSNFVPIPDDMIRGALEHGLHDSKLSLEQTFRFKQANQVDYTSLVQRYGSEKVAKYIESYDSWDGFLRAPIDLTRSILNKIQHSLPIPLFTTNLIRQCAPRMPWFNILLRVSNEPPEVIDAFIQRYPKDLVISYEFISFFKTLYNINLDGMTRLVRGGVLHASQFSRDETSLWDTATEKCVMWLIDVLGISTQLVFECINKAGDVDLVASLKLKYPELANNDLLEHFNATQSSFKEVRESYIVDLWHVTKSVGKPTHKLDLRNHYTWFNPSFEDAFERVQSGIMEEMINTYMPREDQAENGTFWVKRVRVNIKPLLWFQHKKASDLDAERRLLLSNAFALFDVGGLSYKEYTDADEIAQRAKMYMENDKALEKVLHKFDTNTFDCLRVDQNFVDAENGIHDMLQLSDYDGVLSYDVTDDEPDTKSIILFDVPSVVVHEWDWVTI